jgi:hypothetical protein
MTTVRITLSCLVVAGIIGAAAPAMAQTYNFDGESDQDLTGYAGLTWNGFGTLDATDGNPSGYATYTSPDGTVAYNYSGHPASFSSSSSFILGSLDLAAAWRDGLQVTVDGYLGGALVDSAVFTLDSESASLEVLNWTVDTVDFSASGGVNPGYMGNGTEISFDDFTLGEVSGPSVPEPGSLAVLGAGLIGLGLARRRLA